MKLKCTEIKAFTVKCDDFDKWVNQVAIASGMHKKMATVDIDSESTIYDDVRYDGGTRVIEVTEKSYDERMNHGVDWFEELHNSYEDIADVQIIMLYLWKKDFLEKGYYYFSE